MLTRLLQVWKSPLRACQRISLFDAPHLHVAFNDAAERGRRRKVIVHLKWCTTSVSSFRLQTSSTNVLTAPDPYFSPLKRHCVQFNRHHGWINVRGSNHHSIGGFPSKHSRTHHRIEITSSQSRHQKEDIAYCSRRRYIVSPRAIGNNCRHHRDSIQSEGDNASAAEKHLRCTQVLQRDDSRQKQQSKSPFETSNRRIVSDQRTMALACEYQANEQFQENAWQL